MQMRRGSILAETVIVLPILLMLVLGVIQFALVWTAKQVTAYAAFCATRAIMVVPSGEKDYAAKSAAKVALSWMCLAYDRGNPSRGVSVPGWGKVSKADALRDQDKTSDWRVRADILNRGEDEPCAAVEVTFRFPLLIPGMAINRIVATGANSSGLVGEGKDHVKFFKEDFPEAIGAPAMIDGWPYIELKEACVLPMPYSTENFPTLGFDGTDIGGGS